MSISELIQELKELQTCGDIEIAHQLADEALIKYINDKRVADAYGSIDKWYA